MLLEPRFALKVPEEEHRGNQTQRQGNGEAQRPLLHTIDKVHTKQTGYQRGEHQDNGNAGKHLHHLRHIIINNVRIRLHRRFQNV